MIATKFMFLFTKIPGKIENFRMNQVTIRRNVLECLSLTFGKIHIFDITSIPFFYLKFVTIYGIIVSITGFIMLVTLFCIPVI